MTHDDLKRIEKVTDIREVGGKCHGLFVDGADERPWLFTSIDGRVQNGIAFDTLAERENAFEDFKRMMSEFTRH